MSTTFKDHFSDKSSDYNTYRPRYPDQLFSFLASLTPEHDRAWDCATGNGQSAVALAEYYSEAIGTDASENQIKNATQKQGVVYKVENAEHSSLDSGSADLVTVAQALHWFDIETFGKEVNRALKPGGILAVWTYGVLTITPDIDDVINHLYGPTLEPYWPPERKMVEQGYRDVTFPLQPVKAPDFTMEIKWDLAQLVGYLRTWSAVKRYEKANGENPVDEIVEKLSTLWGDADHQLATQWPLTLRLWRKNV